MSSTFGCYLPQGPQYDDSGTMPLGNHPLECVLIERMVFGENGYPLVGRVKRRAL
jgi:hypothetical protein